MDDTVEDACSASDRSQRWQASVLLRDLTKIQLAYLGQAFRGRREALRWLKRALPSELARLAATIQEDLELFRPQLAQSSRTSTSHMSEPQTLRLVSRILSLASDLRVLEHALKKTIAMRGEPAVAAWPFLSITTEMLTREAILTDGTLPRIALVSSIRLGQPTYLPRVDRVIVFSMEDQPGTCRGQCSWSEFLTTGPTAVGEDAQAIFSSELNEDILHTLSLRKVEMGFILRASELS